MDEEILKQIFDELFTSLEPLETQTAALLHFLKAKGIATDEELAPFLDQAGNTANIRWLAARVRTEALISSAMKPSDQEVQKKEGVQGKEEENREKPDNQEHEKKETESTPRAAQKTDDSLPEESRPSTPENREGEKPSGKSQASQQEPSHEVAKQDAKRNPKENVA
jgi:hypothetical protein